MSDEKKFEQLFEDVSDIKRAVIGNPTYGQKGLVERVDHLEKRERRDLIKAAGVTGFIMGGWFVIKALFFKPE